MWPWLLVFCLLPFATSRAGDGQPKVAIVRPVFDFGIVERGTPVEHVFKVQNHGTAPLRIQHVKGTCACTASAVTGREIGPGDETSVTVRLDTGEIAGTTTKTITVYTDDPVTPTFGLALRGEVRSDLVVDPALLYVGTVSRGRASERVVTVRPGRPGGRDRVTRVDAPPFVEARLGPGENGEGQALRVRLRANAPVGRFHHELTLHTTSDTQRSIVLPVFGVIRGPDLDAGS